MFNKIKTLLFKKEDNSSKAETTDIPTSAIISEEKKPSKTTETKKPRKPRKPRQKKVANTLLSEKEKATLENEPYINILKMNVDKENINAGSFELDWNDKFVLNLVRAGYKIREDDTDSDIVDRWFTQVCRNVALEIHEQEMADPSKRANQELRQVTRKDLGNGRSEIS